MFSLAGREDEVIREEKRQGKRSSAVDAAETSLTSDTSNVEVRQARRALEFAVEVSHEDQTVEDERGQGGGGGTVGSGAAALCKVVEGVTELLESCGVLLGMSLEVAVDHGK